MPNIRISSCASPPLAASPGSAAVPHERRVEPYGSRRRRSSALELLELGRGFARGRPRRLRRFARVAGRLLGSVCLKLGLARALLELAHAPAQLARPRTAL